jgi:hypothetical protein
VLLLPLFVPDMGFDGAVVVQDWPCRAVWGLTAPLSFSFGLAGQSDGCVSRELAMLPAVHYLPRSTLTVVTKHKTVTRVQVHTTEMHVRAQQQYCLRQHGLTTVQKHMLISMICICTHLKTCSSQLPYCLTNSALGPVSRHPDRREVEQGKGIVY